LLLPAERIRGRKIRWTSCLLLIMSNSEAVGHSAAKPHHWWWCRRRSAIGWLYSGGGCSGMAWLAFHRLSWTMAAPVHMPLTILLIGNCISWAPPFLSICPSTPSWLRISVAGETHMESTPWHCICTFHKTNGTQIRMSDTEMIFRFLTNLLDTNSKQLRIELPC
jgi:hypothetical protein